MQGIGIGKRLETLHTAVTCRYMPLQGIGIGKRLETLITRAIVPGMQHILSAVDPMDVVLKSKRVQATERNSSPPYAKRNSSRSYSKLAPTPHRSALGGWPSPVAVPRPSP